MILRLGGTFLYFELKAYGLKIFGLFAIVKPFLSFYIIDYREIQLLNVELIRLMSYFSFCGVNGHCLVILYSNVILFCSLVGEI